MKPVRPVTVADIRIGLIGGVSTLPAMVTMALVIQFRNYVTSPLTELVMSLPEIRLW
jgi:hypothetical protein